MVTSFWQHHQPRSLRARLRWTLLLFGSIAAALLAISAIVIDESLERLVIQHTLVAEAQHVVLRNGPATQVQRRNGNTLLKDYFQPSGESTGVSSLQPPPPALTRLAPGFHEGVAMGQRQYYVYVVERAGGRLFVAYDFTWLSTREHWFAGLLAVVVGLILLIAYWLGRVAAERLSRPLAELADTLQGMDPHRRQARVSERRRDIELRQIASAFNGYLQRLDEFIDREQSFTRTVSHELRTPLASIRLASENLKSQLRRCADPAASEPLQRVERATRQMSEIVDSLLALARGGPAREREQHACRVADVILEVIDSHQYQVAGRELTLTAGPLDDTEVAAAPRLLAIMIGNLVRNGIQHTRRGAVTVSLATGRVVVTDTGEGLEALPDERLSKAVAHNTGTSGYGLGLHIVRRICERYGWRLALAAGASGGTSISVDLRVADRGPQPAAAH